MIDIPLDEGKPRTPIAAGFGTGVQISVDSNEQLTSLQTLPLEKMPLPVGAAIVLNLAISSNVFPAQPDTKVNVQPGTFKAVQIVVGKKP
jgi:hypothetical protein